MRFGDRDTGINVDLLSCSLLFISMLRLVS